MLVQLANNRDEHPKITNQRTNVLYPKCSGHEHFPMECSSPINTKGKKFSSYGRREHDITTCWNMLKVRIVVTNNNNQPWNDKTVNKIPYSIKKTFFLIKYRTSL